MFLTKIWIVSTASGDTEREDGVEERMLRVIWVLRRLREGGGSCLVIRQGGLTIAAIVGSSRRTVALQWNDDLKEPKTDGEEGRRREFFVGERRKKLGRICQEENGLCVSIM